MADISALVAQAVQSACAEARRQNSPIVGTPHLFIAVTKLNSEAATALRGQGQDPKQIRDGLRATLRPGQAASGAEPKLTARAARNLQRATELAEAKGAAQVEERHLLAAILEDDPESFTLRALREPGRGCGCTAIRGVCAGTPILDKVGRDLTALARNGELDPLIGRHAQVRQLVRTLARRRRTTRC